MPHDSDEDLIGYCRIHSETPRALFHKNDVVRILQLAGETDAANHYQKTMGEESFLAIHEDEMHPLCDKAMKNLREFQKKEKKRREKDLLQQRKEEDEDILFDDLKGN